MKSGIKSYKPVNYYFIAEPSFWPLIGSFGLFFTVLGIVQLLHQVDPASQNFLGKFFLASGLTLIITTMIGWFGRVIDESVNGLHSVQMDRTYRWGMLWFIVSEVALFGVFFFALFYTRIFTIPELAAAPFDFAKFLMMTKGTATHQFLWPNFQYSWPLLTNPNPTDYPGPHEVVETWGIPALNTAILLSSAVTLTFAHWGLKKGNQALVIGGLILTIVLGFIFEGFQAHEYIKAYTDYHLTLKSGIYGSTFFALTGLHAMHVTIGAIMLSIILIRYLKGHFLPEHHFGFEAVSWYWHFVDVVWLILFVFVYWL